MSGALMLDVAGLTLTEEDKALLQDPVVGGLILFSRNYESPGQLAALVADIRACAPEILIAVDQEGGRVQRFRDGFVRLPPMASLGKLYLQDSAQALVAATELGWLMASELLAYGVDISFAPVLDLDFGVSEVIGDRAFSDRASIAVELSGAFIRGMREAGMASTGKHFPGHGWVAADSHLEIPVDERSLADIEALDMAVFARLMEQGLDAVMPAHVIYREVDSQPAGFSEFWMQGILRQKLSFNGVIFSDDLTMEGASVAGGYPERSAVALKAGCDMLLVCNNRKAALEVRDYLHSIDHGGSERIASMLARDRADIVALQASSRWQSAENLAAELIAV
ncbi:beta-N-acetylhexosaminidase [Amphritea sp. HPY]|uniref:beta-N-acetylhexosaminidase n=1 Tax=Amphritea sp. HPY TaxID=3421652 RepID=UPI003D7D7E1D